MALGDSYTIGESVKEHERWPVQLFAKLKAEGLDIQPPLIIAKTGWTTDELQQGIDRQGLNETFDLVSLLIGVNNQYRGYKSEEYATGFELLLKQAIRFSGGESDRMIVLSIPDYGVTPFVKEKALDADKIFGEINMYNSINKRLSDDYGVSYIDITPISRTAAVDNSLLASDGLHPSGRMYKQWVEKIYPVVREKLLKSLY